MLILPNICNNIVKYGIKNILKYFFGLQKSQNLTNISRANEVSENIYLCQFDQLITWVDFILTFLLPIKYP